MERGLLGRIVWVDCCAAMLSGTVVLALRSWLSTLYAVPGALLGAMSAVSFLYGAYGAMLIRHLSCAPRVERARVIALIAANVGWSAVCVAIAIRFRATASAIGLTMFLFEAAFVAALALAEARALGRLR